MRLALGRFRRPRLGDGAVPFLSVVPGDLCLRTGPYLPATSGRTHPPRATPPQHGMAGESPVHVPFTTADPLHPSNANPPRRFEGPHTRAHHAGVMVWYVLWHVLVRPSLYMGRAAHLPCREGQLHLRPFGGRWLMNNDIQWFCVVRFPGIIALGGLPYGVPVIIALGASWLSTRLYGNGKEAIKTRA